MKHFIHGEKRYSQNELSQNQQKARRNHPKKARAQLKKHLERRTKKEKKGKKASMNKEKEKKENRTLLIQRGPLVSPI